MKLTESSLLNEYQYLILASLRAQARDDAVTEDQIIDELDALWMRMTTVERAMTEDLNKEAMAWHALEQQEKTVMRSLFGSVVLGGSDEFSRSVGLLINNFTDIDSFTDFVRWDLPLPRRNSVISHDAVQLVMA